MTIRQLLKSGRSQLQQAQLTTSQREVEELFLAASQWPKNDLITRGHLDVSPAVEQKFAQLLAARVLGQPSAYILGRTSFLGYPLRVDSRVLIPRVETELLVELTIERLRKTNPRRLDILDVGTGSGCIAISLKKAFPTAVVDASDSSAGALAVAKANAEALAVEINFYGADLLVGLPTKKYDLIVANLPYVPSPELANLSQEVTGYEPTMALDGGADGLALIQKLVTQLPNYTHPDSLVAFEIWHSHGQPLSALLKNRAGVQIAQDLAGRDRYAFLTFPAHQE